MDENKSFYEINNKKFKIFIPAEKITQRIKELGFQISKDYSGKKPLFLIILKGSIFFASDLLRLIELDCRIETISVKSYGNEMKSSGNVEVGMASNIDFTGQDIIIIEDIVDTGTTLNYLINKISEYRPASLEVAALLVKPEQNKYDIKVKYMGFEVPPAFIIGYGLDYAEKGRQLPDIYALADE